MNKPIHIMYVRDSSGIFGAERVILSLARNIDPKHFIISLLCLRRPDGRSEALISRAREEGINVVTVEVNKRLDFRAILKVREIFREKQIKLFHSHDFKSDFYGLLASINTETKRVTTAHGSTKDSFLKKAYLYFGEKVVYSFFDAIIAVSKDLQYKLPGNLTVAKKLHVIQNGLDFDLIQSESVEKNINAPITIPKDHLVFGVIGRLFPDKGHRFFLDAFSRVHRKYPSTIGVIVGSGPAQDEIANITHRLGLQDSVLLTGVRSDMKNVYDKIDYLVIPSLTEGLPYVLLEAMAAKIPVLSTSVGDIPLLIEDGKSGYLVPAGSADALEEKMIKLIENPGSTKLMAQQAQQLVFEKYSAVTMAQKTENLYFSLLHDQPCIANK